MHSIKKFRFDSVKVPYGADVSGHKLCSSDIPMPVVV